MGLFKKSSAGDFKEFSADITNNFLYVDGVQYVPYETANIMDELNVYYKVPKNVHDDLCKAYRFSSFVMFADTDNITREFYKPTSMCNSNGGLVLGNSDKAYFVIIDDE